MAILKHIDFQVPGWSEFQQGPMPRPDYRSQVLADSPLIYLRLGEASGPTAFDETGQHHATEVGVMDWAQAGSLLHDPDTAVGSAGTGGLSVNETGWLPVGSESRTIEMWFRPNANSVPTSGMFYGSFQTGAAIILTLTPTRVSVTVFDCEVGVSNLNFADEWHHAAFVFPDGATRCDEFVIYLDGVLFVPGVIFGDGATLINTTDSALNINMLLVNLFNNGLVDEFAIYGTALTAQRIKEHYDSALGRLGS